MIRSVPITSFVNDSYFPHLGRNIAPMPSDSTITCSSSPALIVLALNLLQSCDVSKLASVYDIIAHRILSGDDLMFPEMLSPAIELIGVILPLMLLPYSGRIDDDII